MYSVPQSARSEVPLSSRSYMSNADDISVLHSYRAQQRAQKKDSMSSSIHSIQSETTKLVDTLATKLNQQPTLRKILQNTVTPVGNNIGTHQSTYFSISSLMELRPVKDFIRVEDFVRTKEEELKNAQSVYAAAASEVAAANTAIESLATQLGESTLHLPERTASKMSLSKLAIAKERQRHLNERLDFLNQQIPRESLEDIKSEGSRTSLLENSDANQPSSLTLTPSEAAHKKRLEAEKSKLVLLKQRHTRLAAVKHLMELEQQGRNAIIGEWEGISPLYMYMASCVPNESEATNGDHTPPGEDLLLTQRSEDSPIVPAAHAAQKSPLQPRNPVNDGNIIVNRFKQMLAESTHNEVKCLQAVYHTKRNEYEALVQRMGHLPPSGVRTVSSTASLESLQLKIKKQEEEIENLQQQIVALEEDLSPSGNYVDLEAMLLELRPQEPGSAPPLGHEASSALGKMAQWATAYGQDLIACAKEIAAAESESLRLAQQLADIEVQRSDFVIRAQYKGHHSAEQRQLDALETLRGLEAALLAADKESAALRAGILELEAQAAQRQSATQAIDVQRSEYFGKEAQLEGEKRDLQRELEQLTFVLESVQRAANSLEH